MVEKNMIYFKEVVGGGLKSGGWTRKKRPGLGVGNSFPIRQGRGGEGQLGVEKNFSTLSPIFESRLPLDRYWDNWLVMYFKCLTQRQCLSFLIRTFNDSSLWWFELS
jgi:hypothetical protein